MNPYKVVISRSLSRDVFEVRIMHRTTKGTRYGCVSSEGRLEFYDAAPYAQLPAAFEIDGRDQDAVFALIGELAPAASVWESK